MMDLETKRQQDKRAGEGERSGYLLLVVEAWAGGGGGGGMLGNRGGELAARARPVG